MSKTAIVESLVIGGAVFVALGLVGNQGKIIQVIVASGAVMLSKGIASQVAAKV